MSKRKKWKPFILKTYFGNLLKKHMTFHIWKNIPKVKKLFYSNKIFCIYWLIDENKVNVKFELAYFYSLIYLQRSE